MRLKALIAVGVIIALAAAWLMLGNAHSTDVAISAPAVTEIPATAVKPTVRDVTIYIEAIGTLQPSSFLEVRPQVNGTVQQILVAEGDWVNPGTPLLRIEELPYQIKVQELESQLASDQLTLEAANKKLNRFRGLADKDLIAQSEWDEWETRGWENQIANGRR